MLILFGSLLAIDRNVFYSIVTAMFALIFVFSTRFVVKSSEVWHQNNKTAILTYFWLSLYALFITNRLLFISLSTMILLFILSSL